MPSLIRNRIGLNKNIISHCKTNKAIIKNVTIECIEDHIVIVQIDHLEAKNAPNTKVRKQLAKIFSELALNDNIRVVILNGGESVFAAGTDLKELSSAQTAKMYLRHIEYYWQAITHYPKSVIAAVNGYAVSGG